MRNKTTLQLELDIDEEKLKRVRKAVRDMAKAYNELSDATERLTAATKAHGEQVNRSFPVVTFPPVQQPVHAPFPTFPQPQRPWMRGTEITCSNDVNT